VFPAWPNPGGRSPGTSWRAAAGASCWTADRACSLVCASREPWPELDAIAITHWHLDHWGDLVPWVWGRMFGPGEDTKDPSSGSRRGAPKCSRGLARRLGFPDMFSGTFDLNEYVDGEPFETAGFEVTAERVLHYELLAFGFRASANGSVLAYSGDSGRATPCRDWHRTPTSSSVRRHCWRRTRKAAPAATSPPTRRSRPSEAADAKRLLLTHRPSERPLDSTLEQAHDGMELEVR